jgi:hypothetical protein
MEHAPNGAEVMPFAGELQEEVEDPPLQLTGTRNSVIVCVCVCVCKRVCA